MKISRVFLASSLISFLSIYPSAAQTPITGSGAAQYVPKFIDTSQIGNSILYLSGTDSIGAGTNIPQGRIHSKIGAGLSNFILESDATVPGSGSSLGQIDWYNSSYGGNVRARIVAMADGAWSGGLYPTRLSFYTNNYGSMLSERMRIDLNGFVGIGTSNPTSILHTIASGAKIAAFTGNLLTNTATSSTAGITKYGLDVLSTGTWNGSGAKNIGLHVSATGGVENYAAIFDGRVGIGTSTPAHGLDVGLSWITGGDNSNLKRNFLNLSATSSYGAVDIIYPNAGRARFCETGVAGLNDVLLQLLPGPLSGYGYLETYDGAGTIIGTGNLTPIIFRPARAERMRLDPVGNFGIGTTTPKNRLDVAGSIVLGNTYAGTTVAATNALLVEGSIGIGTTTPGATVDVNGSLKSNSLTIGTTVISNYPARIVGSNTAQGFPLLYLSESTPATTGVTYCLSAIHSGGAASGGIAYGISGTSTGNETTGGKNIGGIFNATGNTTNYSIQIEGPPAGANNYAIYSPAKAQSYFAGNIGIGTTNPDTFKLKADGSIKAKEVVVDVNGWPDYVFEDGHKLLPLEELEKEVRTSKHLPGIPNAQEIKSNGLHVADMQVKMMKKIEELTLYVIEIKKDNALLHARLSKLSH